MTCNMIYSSLNHTNYVFPRLAVNSTRITKFLPLSQTLSIADEDTFQQSFSREDSYLYNKTFPLHEYRSIQATLNKAIVLNIRRVKTLGNTEYEM